MESSDIGWDALWFAILMMVGFFILYATVQTVFPVIQDQVGHDATGVCVLIIILILFVPYAFKAVGLSLSFKYEFERHKSLYIALIFFIGLYCIAIRQIPIVDWNLPLDWSWQIPMLNYTVAVEDIVLLAWILIYTGLLIRSRSKPNLRFGWFSLAMIGIFALGVVLILGFTHQMEYLNSGNLTLSLHECNSGSNQIGGYNIHCADMQGKMIAGRKATCNLPPNATGTKGCFSVTYLNGSGNKTNFEDGIWFIIPESSGTIYFNMTFTNSSGVCVNALGNSNAYFPTYEEYTRYRDAFASYMITLLAFIFITAPFLYKQYSELYDDFFSDDRIYFVLIDERRKKLLSYLNLPKTQRQLSVLLKTSIPKLAKPIKELMEKDLIKCLTHQMKTSKSYILTPKGKEILKKIAEIEKG